MKRLLSQTPFLLIMVLLVSCTVPPSPPSTPTETSDVGPTSEPVSDSTPTMPPDANPVVISEVLGGIQGNNNYDFIELYNRSSQAVDLRGWSIWYRLPNGQEDLLVYLFTTTTLIPPQGHLLLGRQGEEFGLPVDAQFEQPINTSGGGLQLRHSDESVQDALGWGNPPTGFLEQVAAPALTNGTSLERLSGGNAGSMTDSDNNFSDFILNSTPSPQNTGSEQTPVGQACLSLSLTAPNNAEPGSEYTYNLTIANQTETALSDINVTFPIPEQLVVTESAISADLASGITLEGNTITWNIAALSPNGSTTLAANVSVPWTYFTALANNYSAASVDCVLPVHGGPVSTTIEGGIVPIGTARGLQGSDLTIEGIATFYTGGLYAGTNDTKFYIQDETGGIQVQVFEGEGSVAVGIGSHVQVRGTVGIYRGAIQIVPIVVPDDVIRFEDPVEPLPANPISIGEAITDQTELPGSLIQVEGTVTRVEEFNYSYEIDLVDPNGDAITLYVDKMTNINVEIIEVGQQYRMTGILEMRDTSPLLYPRIQEDLERIFPPELILEVDAPIFITGNNLITYTLTAYNHTTAPLTNVTIQAGVPSDTTVVHIFDGGSQTGDLISWTIPEIPGSGANSAVRFVVSVSNPNIDIVLLNNTSATAAEWLTPTIGAQLRTFAGTSVPIWAIQGDGYRSAYVFDELTTEGIVTGFFPELGGFFIQEIDTDTDPLTASGLFVSTGTIELNLVSGDFVRVSGLVRELSNQTALQVLDPANLVVLSQANSLPAAVELDPPPTVAEADNYFEALEGMLVQVTGPAVAVSPTSKYGEYVVVLAEHGVDRLYQGQDNGIAIMVDDGSNIEHTDNSTIAYTVTTGDTISGLIGPLAFTFDCYKIEPITLPSVQPTGVQPVGTQPLAENEFSLMTWNVLDLFDMLDPTPADMERPSLDEYRGDLDAAAGTIAAANFPTIVALQEVENLGILEDIAANELLIGYDYQPVLIEGIDGRGIDVGYLVRGDQARIISVEQLAAPGSLFTRPPLLLNVEVTTSTGVNQVFVINNHFLSMSGGEEATEPRRADQAAWNVSLVQEILSEHPGALVAVVGDLNSFYDSLPIQVLREGGLIPVMDRLTVEERYSYIYQGESEVLDYIVVTSSLWDLLERVEVLHINADFPPQAVDDTSPVGESDHDPVIAVFAP